MIRKIISRDNIISLIGKRKLYIWGSGHFGTSIKCAMSRIGIEVAGFMDTNMSGHQFLDFSVHTPDEILALGREKVFIVLSPFRFSGEMALYCEGKGFIRSMDYLMPTDIKPYHFEIEVSGRCNLRCITCPQGNYQIKHEKEMMSSAVFENVLNKLIHEIPLLSDIQLYSWGEPLLNPELPEMISYASSKGLTTAVSSNLSLHANLDAVVKAAPTWFRISLSGADEKEYSTVHRGGNWKLVLENMRRLSELRIKHAPTMFVDVNYHLYQHNMGGVKKMAEWCRELGFILRTNYAYLDPLDVLIEYAKGVPLPKNIEEGRKLLLLDIDEAIKISKSSKENDCVSQNCFVIHSDLSFRRCNHLYANKDNIIVEDYLQSPLDSILSLADNCDICRTCRLLGLHRFFFAYFDKGTELGELST